MKNLKFFVPVLFMLFSLTLVSCDNDESKPLKFEEGVYVVNEGNFNDGDGTVSHISTDGTVTLDLFGKVNNKLELGSVVQSMSIVDDRAYIVVNNSNKIEVVDGTTFKSVYTLSDLKLPRYMTTFNGKGYFTEWVSFVESGRVSILNLESGVVEGTIPASFGAENIIEHDGKLYVSNNFSNTISVIDPVEKEVIKTIEVGSGPGELLVDSEDMIWVICGGDFNENNGQLAQIDPDESDNEESNSVTKTIELEMNVTPKAVISKAGDKIVFFKGNSVYSISTSASEVPAEPLRTEAAATSFYGISIDPETDVIYVGDSKGFIGNGTAYSYTLAGVPVDNFAVGRGPNGFVFIK